MATTPMYEEDEGPEAAIKRARLAAGIIPGTGVIPGVTSPGGYQPPATSPGSVTATGQAPAGATDTTNTAQQPAPSPTAPPATAPTAPSPTAPAAVTAPQQNATQVAYQAAGGTNYGFHQEPDGKGGWITVPDAGYQTVTDPSGAMYTVKQENAGALQDALNVNIGNPEVSRILAQDGTIPGFNVWQAQEDGTFTQAPWNGGVGDNFGVATPENPGTAPQFNQNSPASTFAGINPSPSASGSPASAGGLSPQIATLLERLRSSDPAAIQQNVGQSVASGFQSFGPGNDLRGTQINPVASAASTRARELALKNLEDMNSAPDRLGLVERAIALAREKSQPGFESDQRAVGQKAAAFGRIGSGLVNRDLADLVTDRERGFNQLREGLTIDAMGKTLGDRQSLLSSALSAGGQFRGEDLSDRNELRGERDWQNTMSQQAIDNFVRQKQLEEDILNGMTGRDNSRTALMLSAANLGGDPTSALLRGSDSYGAQSDESLAWLEPIIEQYLMRRQAA